MFTLLSLLQTCCCWIDLLRCGAFFLLVSVSQDWMKLSFRSSMRILSVVILLVSLGFQVCATSVLFYCLFFWLTLSSFFTGYITLISGKTKRGELSIFPRSFILLSHCLHMMPRKAENVNAKVKQFHCGCYISLRFIFFCTNLFHFFPLCRNLKTGFQVNQEILMHMF